MEEKKGVRNYNKHYVKKCAQCGKDLNPVEVLLGSVCGDCCRKNHREVVENGRS